MRSVDLLLNGPRKLSYYNNLIYFGLAKFKIIVQQNYFSQFINKKHGNVKDSTLILLTKGEELKVKAKSMAKFLVISGKPINEVIARGGPFVMNTKAEILQAVEDYHSGTFVK